MTTPLTDRAALSRNRARAEQRPVSFLQEAARAEIEDRLAMVNKTFSDPAIVTGWPQFWSGLLSNSVCVADDETLELAEGSFDCVIHAMGLHWANDPVGQLIQCRRALRPDGLFLAVCFGGETLTELRACFGQAEVDLFGGLSPRVAPMAEIRGLGALLQRAGLALPVADLVPLKVSYPTPLHLMRELRQMGEANAMSARQRAPMRRALLDRVCELYAGNFGDGAGRVKASFDLIVLTGWAPDDSQPKPLRPGSANFRLAEALGTQETPVKD